MKINISPKEIAQFLNIEPRSVYMSFYRIRKKLNVNAEEFMEEFILEKQLA
jgi:DNA-binding CsgD family transcriptional regulator